MSSLPNEAWADVLAYSTRWELDQIGTTSKRIFKLTQENMKQKRIIVSALIGESDRFVDLWRVVFVWRKGEKRFGRLTIDDCANANDAIQHATFRTLGDVYIESVVIHAFFGYVSPIGGFVPVQCKELFVWHGLVSVDSLYLRVAAFSEQQRLELESLTQKGIRDASEWKESSFIE